MTTVIIQQDKDFAYKGLVFWGHAGYARRSLFRRQTEKDVVCASISVLVMTTLNSLEVLANEPMDMTSNEDEGFIRYIFQEPLHEKSSFLIDSMIFGLEQIKQEYGEQYLQIIFEEV